MCVCLSELLSGLLVWVSATCNGHFVFLCVLSRSMSAPVHLARSDSKPFVAVLERSSQLVEDTFTEEPRVIIDATPPIAKRGRRGKKIKKRSIEEVAKEDSFTPDVKKGKYQLRNRKKHKRFIEVLHWQHIYIHV